jgi:integrase
MTGNITRRGERSWRLKFDAGRDPASGKRLTRLVTVRGTKREAQLELTRQLAALDAGTLVEPSKATLADYLNGWIEMAATLTLSPKTSERYRQLIGQQVIPHLGAYPLQKLRASHVATWHATLLKSGGKEGHALSARTVGHAHRVLHKALEDACRREVIGRNPVAIVSPPRVAPTEMAALSGEEVKAVLAAMKDTSIYTHVVVLLSTGVRRGELMGLQWGDVDLDAGKLRIERSIEKTKAGLRVKAPKTRHGRRLITLPSSAVAVLREHRKAQLELRLALGAGRPSDDAFVFGSIDGKPRDPDRITQDWKRFAAARGLPRVTLHALRHSHASALIASGTDPVTVSRRLGHGSPTVTMSVYAHLFGRSDEAAAEAMDAAMGLKEK